MRLACALLFAATPVISSGTPLGVPDKDEIALIKAADDTERQIDAGTALLKDAAIDEYLDRVGRALLVAAKPPVATEFRIRATSNANPSAYILANGAAYVSAGLLARLDNEAELAAVLSREIAHYLDKDQLKKNRKTRRTTLSHFIPNLALLTVTAGLGVQAVSSWDDSVINDFARELELGADKRSLDILATAGYRVAEAPRAFTALRDVAQAAGVSGAGRLADSAYLAERSDSLTHTIADTPAYASADGKDGRAEYLERARILRRNLASLEIGQYRLKSAALLLDRYERDYQPDGMSWYLRGEIAQRGGSGDEARESALSAYLAATKQKDAPAIAFKELGMLYRHRGVHELARQAFAKYLELKPDASDAEIIRVYLGEK